ELGQRTCAPDAERFGCAEIDWDAIVERPDEVDCIADVNFADPTAESIDPDGSREQPYLSVAAAVADGPLLVIVGGSPQTDDTLRVAPSTSIFGGFSAAPDFHVDLNQRPVWTGAPTAAGDVVGIQAANISADTRTLLSHLGVATTSVITPGRSNYGVHVANAPGLLLRDIDATAGAAGPGAAGEDGEPFEQPAAAGGAGRAPQDLNVEIDIRPGRRIVECPDGGYFEGSDSIGTSGNFPVPNCAMLSRNFGLAPPRSGRPAELRPTAGDSCLVIYTPGYRTCQNLLSNESFAANFLSISVPGSWSCAPGDDACPDGLTCRHGGCVPLIPLVDQTLDIETYQCSGVAAVGEPGQSGVRGGYVDVDGFWSADVDAPGARGQPGGTGCGGRGGWCLRPADRFEINGDFVLASWEVDGFFGCFAGRTITVRADRQLNYQFGAGTGGGGMGGLGGRPGAGGRPGGASIGLFVWETPQLQVQGSVFSSSTGGDGGLGGESAPGQLGGQGGAADTARQDGATGAVGAAGGPGGGGAGGPSYAAFCEASELAEGSTFALRAGLDGAPGRDGGERPDATCADIVNCVDTQMCQDAECLEACEATGAPASQAIFASYYACLMGLVDSCPGLMGEEYDACVRAQCGAEVDACDLDEGADGPGPGPASPLQLGCVSGCGDGLIGVGEACDDGNTLDGDGCSSTCELVDQE
ncbi:MAG: cysteine-rich repeat protein, partial [Bradymonadia bacterium]